MFRRFALALVMSVIVPILGLSSCSKDGTTDTWGLKEPSLVAGSVSFPASHADHRTLPYSTELKFNGSEWASLKIKSSCVLGGVTYTDSFSLNVRESVDLKSLWPRTLTDHFGNQDLRTSVCDFAFAAANEKGSTHDFQLTDIKLETFVNPGEKLNLKAELTKNAVTPLSFHRDQDYLASVISELSKSVDQANRINFKCDGFSIEAELDEAQAAVSALFSKSTFSGTHSCYFVVRAQGAETNEFAISAAVPIRFSNLQLPVTVKPYAPIRFRGAAFQRIEIANPNSEQATLLVPSSIPVLRMKNAYLWDNSLFIGPTEATIPLKREVSGATELSQDQFVVPANGTAVVELWFDNVPISNCSSFGMGKTASVAGIRWGLSSPFVIQELEDGQSSGAVIYTAPVISNRSSYPASEIFDGLRDRFGPTVPDFVQPGSDYQNSTIPRC